MKGTMPSGTITGGGGSLTETMPMAKFAKMADHWIEVSTGDAKHMSISLGPVTPELSDKVRLIVKMSGFHFAETEEQVEVAIKIAASAMVMLGAKPNADDIRYLVRS